MNNETEIEFNRVVYFDGNFAVVYKKIGEICESEVKDSSLSLIHNALPELQKRSAAEITFAEAVHRIDQPVSGCVVLALDKKTHALLSEQFATGQIRKKYLAIIEKNETISRMSEGRLEHLIRFDAKHHKATAVLAAEVRKPGPEWKKAILEWKLIGSGERYMFLEVDLKTGRTHQIRAQLSASGMMIKGDLKYGAKRSEPLGGIRLHAWKMQFKHPYTGDSLTIVCPVQNPDALWQACQDCAQ